MVGKTKGKSEKIILTTYATNLLLIYSMCARSMKMSFPDPSENHQPYTKNSVKIIQIYIFVHFRQPCNANKAERKEKGSVLSVFEQYFLFSRLACLYSNCSYIFITHTQIQSLPKRVLGRSIPEQCVPECSTSVWDCFISWTMRPRMMRPLDNECYSLSTHPLDDASLG